MAVITNAQARSLAQHLNTTLGTTMELTKSEVKVYMQAFEDWLVDGATTTPTTSWFSALDTAVAGKSTPFKKKFARAFLHFRGGEDF